MPLVVHSLEFVPTEYQKHAKLMYYYWLELFATLVFNFLGCLFLLTSGENGGM